MNVRLPLMTLLLGTANALLAATVVWRLLMGSEVAELKQVDAVVTPTAGPPWTLPQAASVDSITSLAVFHRSRSFYVAPAPQIIVQPPPDYRLAGYMTFPGRPASAVLVHAQTGERTRVAVGDALEGWAVASVTPNIVTLQLDGRTVEVVTAASAQLSGMSVTPMARNTAAPAGVTRVLGNAAARDAPESVENGRKLRSYKLPNQQ